MSTLQVDRIEPYQSASVEIVGLNIDTTALNQFTASQEALNSTFATTGSNNFTGNQTINANSNINLDPGGDIQLFENGTDTAAIKFYSGSVPGEKYINMQVVPATDGKLTISSYPGNNHFLFMDPNLFKITVEAPLEGGGGVPQVKFNEGIIVSGSTSSFYQNIEVTGSVSINGDETVNGNDRVNGHIYQELGAQTTAQFRQNEQFYTDYYGNNLLWNPNTGGGVAALSMYEKTRAVIEMNAWTGSYDEFLAIKLQNGGASFSDWSLPSYTQTPWLTVPQQGTPAFQRGLDVTGSVGIGEVMTLAPQDPLPAGAVGQVAVSGSTLYFNDGTWRAVSLV